MRRGSATSVTGLLPIRQFSHDLWHLPAIAIKTLGRNHAFCFSRSVDAAAQREIHCANGWHLGKGLSHLESLEPAKILGKAREIELHDRWSMRNYGLDHRPPIDCPVNIAVLTNQAAIFPTVERPAEDATGSMDSESS